jgi:ketosteroid isomerase-like protein
MPGCFVAPDPCAPQQEDPQSQDQEDRAYLVTSFIDALWNEPWTGTPLVMPQAATDALANLVHANFVRHRRDGSGNRKMESGTIGLIYCLELVHNAVTDLVVTILDTVVCGDCVTVLFRIDGVDQRRDGQTNVAGLFGAAAPTGRRFRAHSAVLFCIEDGLIRDDHLLYGADILFSGPSLVGHQP